jgi:hypothetical protein
VDGTQALAEQELALQFLEAAAFAQVISFGKGGTAGITANEAVLEDLPLGSLPPAPLHLVAGPVAEAGTTVFRGDAFVSGAVQRVLGFR